MRKSVVLALVLVLALAGATFAATPQFSGKLEVEAKSDGSFVGPFNLTAGATVNLKFAEEGENWTASVGLAGINLFGSQTIELVDADGNVLVPDKEDDDYDENDPDTWVPAKITVPGGSLALANYKATFQGDGFDVAVARNQSVGGAKGDPFGFYGLSDKPAASNDGVDRIRLNTSLVGVPVSAQLASNTKELRARTAGEADAFSWGVTAGVDLSDTSKFGFVADGGLGLGIVDVFAAAGSVGGATVWGIGAEAQVTEQLSVDAEYLHDNSWEVGAAYTEGLLKATAGFDSTNAAEVGLTYRGDSGNVAFGDLFKKAHYWKNVAPAFGGSYETKDSKVTLNATAPLADNFAVLGNVTMAGGTTNFNLDARYAVNAKFTIEPYYKSKDTQFGSDFKYAVGEGASIALNLDSKNSNASSSVKFTVEF